ncbi:MAG: single-stranded-DNA-specific exonuclease RecJ [Dehalococcoidia bacterium]|nr:single-stranded-DNA-specific exonuclease RecJ [Dehalococcoidia bacterium]
MGHAMKYRWRVPPPVPPNERAALAGLSPVLVRLLHNRGMRGRAEADAFLAPGPELQADPSLLPDIDLAVARLLKATRSGEAIGVFGDFDCDGVTSAAVLALALEGLGGRIVPYIPDRVSEGHGLNVAALETLRRAGCRLVVTTDCGVSNVAEVAQAVSMGMDVIITDHHTVPPSLPPALAVVNPRRTDSRYPPSDLASVGVSYKVAQALYQAAGQPEREDLLDLVAVGTIADLSPLLRENRYLVTRGLAELNQTQKPGLRALLAQSGVKPGAVDVQTVSYALAPRINAASRMDHASASYRLLVTPSADEARQIAAELDMLNGERKRLTEELAARAEEQVAQRGLAPLLMVQGAEFPPGIVGLVASRLVDGYGRPAVVVSAGDQLSRGSCRSIPEFNIVAALTECKDLFVQFGGHAQAAGFTIESAKLGTLRERLVDIAARQLAGVDLRPVLDVDAEAGPSALVGPPWVDIQRMAPFGVGNPQPTFVARGARVAACRPVGNGGKHLSMSLRHNGAIWSGIAFGLGDISVRSGDCVDAAYTLLLDTWNGETTLKLKVLDVALAGPGR